MFYLLTYLRISLQLSTPSVILTWLYLDPVELAAKSANSGYHGTDVVKDPSLSESRRSGRTPILSQAANRSLAVGWSLSRKRFVGLAVVIFCKSGTISRLCNLIPPSRLTNAVAISCWQLSASQSINSNKVIIIPGNRTIIIKRHNVHKITYYIVSVHTRRSCCCH